MRTDLEPWDLAGDLLWRSACRVKVGAVLVDAQERIFAWGWNHCGADGLGMCAERHALQRANPRRLNSSTIVIQGWNGRNPSVSLPCRMCYDALVRSGVTHVQCLNKSKIVMTTLLSMLNVEELVYGRHDALSLDR